MNTMVIPQVQSLSIKSKPEEIANMKDVDDNSTWFLVSTKVYKIFNDVEYKDTVTGYEPKKRLYHILYLSYFKLYVTLIRDVIDF